MMMIRFHNQIDWSKRLHFLVFYWIEENVGIHLKFKRRPVNISDVNNNV